MPSPSSNSISWWRRFSQRPSLRPERFIRYIVFRLIIKCAFTFIKLHQLVEKILAETKLEAREVYQVKCAFTLIKLHQLVEKILAETKLETREVYQVKCAFTLINLHQLVEKILAETKLEAREVYQV
jgi:hypothetical protein